MKINNEEDKSEKDTTENCYLVYDEQGYLTCDFNHKAGEKCLMDYRNPQT